MAEIKVFPANPKHQYHASQWGEHDWSAHNKKMKIIMSIRVCLSSWINFDYKKNYGKKSFSCISKASISCVAVKREHDCSADNKKYSDYCGYLSLSYFMIEH